jgi:hypothetical protein
MAVPVGCWPNANAANSSRPCAFFSFFSGLFFGRAPCEAPCEAPCGPMRPHAAPCGHAVPCTGGFRSDPCHHCLHKPHYPLQLAVSNFQADAASCRVHLSRIPPRWASARLRAGHWVLSNRDDKFDAAAYRDMWCRVRSFSSRSEIRSSAWHRITRLAGTRVHKIPR